MLGLHISCGTQCSAWGGHRVARCRPAYSSRRCEFVCQARCGSAACGGWGGGIAQNRDPQSKHRCGRLADSAERQRWYQRTRARVVLVEPHRVQCAKSFEAAVDLVSADFMCSTSPQRSSAFVRNAIALRRVVLVRWCGDECRPIGDRSHSCKRRAGLVERDRGEMKTLNRRREKFQGDLAPLELATAERRSI